MSPISRRLRALSESINLSGWICLRDHTMISWRVMDHKQLTWIILSELGRKLRKKIHGAAASLLKEGTYQPLNWEKALATPLFSPSYSRRDQWLFLAQKRHTFRSWHLRRSPIAVMESGGGALTLFWTVIKPIGLWLWSTGSQRKYVLLPTQKIFDDLVVVVIRRAWDAVVIPKCLPQRRCVFSRLHGLRQMHLCLVQKIWQWELSRTSLPTFYA